jgi:hypothetical protein
MPIADLIDIVENTAIPLGLVAGLLALLATRSGRKVLGKVFRKVKSDRSDDTNHRPVPKSRK